MKEIKLLHKMKNIYDNRFLNKDMYNELGYIADMFSSAYSKDIDISRESVKKIWGDLFIFFLNTPVYDNKFEAISIMNDLYVYSKRSNININNTSLREWYEGYNEDLSEEIIDCVKNILI